MRERSERAFYQEHASKQYEDGVVVQLREHTKQNVCVVRGSKQRALFETIDKRNTAMAASRDWQACAKNTSASR